MALFLKNSIEDWQNNNNNNNDGSNNWDSVLYGVHSSTDLFNCMHSIEVYLACIIVNV